MSTNITEKGFKNRGDADFAKKIYKKTLSFVVNSGKGEPAFFWEIICYFRWPESKNFFCLEAVLVCFTFLAINCLFLFVLLCLSFVVDGSLF